MKNKTKKEETTEQPQQAQPAPDAPQPPPAAQANGATAEAPPAAAPAPAVPPPLPPPMHPAEERLLRLRADFDNLRKRFDRERQDMAVLSNERIIRELLPVLDHFELALAAATQHNTDKAVQNGFRIVYDQLCASLTGFGLKPMEAHGKPFDPNFHEAISHQPSAEVPDHAVILQTRRGYLLGDRLLRAAQVIVSSGPPQPATPDPAPAPVKE